MVTLKDFILDCETDTDFIEDILSDSSFTTSLKQEVIDWLDENCEHWVFHGVITLPGEYNEGLSFEFADDLDFVAFKLRWA